MDFMVMLTKSRSLQSCFLFFCGSDETIVIRAGIMGLSVMQVDNIDFHNEAYLGLKGLNFISNEHY